MKSMIPARRARWFALLLPLLLASGMPSPAVGGEGAESCCAAVLDRERAAFDDATGTDARNFAPDRWVDVRHLRLDLRFDAIGPARFDGRATFTVAAIGAPVELLEWDAVRLAIAEVSCPGHAVEVAHDGRRLALRFDPPLPPVAERVIAIDYACRDPEDGMFFTPGGDDPGSAQVHTLSQAIGARHWFPCHDAPNERMTTEVVVDVPIGFTAISNGRLIGHDGSESRERWHWRLDRPHVAYLVSIAIGRFEAVALEHPRVPMTAWVPPGRGDDARLTFARTGAMIDALESFFGLPFPWDRYDQVLARSFGSGGMEHTTATTLYDAALFTERDLADGDLDSLIAHELCHQWSGDLWTCADWSDLWLNEGFATYGETIWFEARDGEEGYLADVLANAGVARRDRADAGVAMCSNRYDHPDDVFRRRANPYSKGASVLHMLRETLGDALFLEGVRLFARRHAFDVVETADLRAAMEEVSGRSLGRFFDQWCFRAGCPTLEVATAWDASARMLEVRVRQAQPIDEASPAFAFELPISAEAGGVRHDLRIAVDARETVARFPLPAPPESVAIDPRLAVLAEWRIEKPEAWWRRQAMVGPTLPARHRALAHLAETDDAIARSILVETIADASLHRSVRRRAAESLGAHGSPESRALLLELIGGRAPNDAPTRRALVGVAGRIDRPEIDAHLARIAAEDDSDAVRAAAIEALGRRESAEALEPLLGLADRPSRRDAVSLAVLDALVACDDARGVDLALALAAYGGPDRTRASALRAAGRLAAHDPDRVVPLLVDLLDDPQASVRRAAGAALVSAGDPRGLDPLRRRAASHVHPSERRRAEEWLEQLAKEAPKRD